MKFRWLFITIVTWLSFFSADLTAHSLHIFAQYDGRNITGRAYYSDQTPAAETYVEAYNCADLLDRAIASPIVTGKTDSHGYFRLPISENGQFKVVIEAMEGHRAEYIADNIMPIDALDNQTQFELLRKDIQKLKDKIYFHDILGGFGYILGFFGIISLVKNRKGQ